MTKSSKHRIARRRPARQSLYSNAIKVMAVDVNRADGPLDTFIVSEDLTSAIGKVAISWSKFEIYLDDAVFSLEKALGEPAEARNRSFRARKERCATLASRVFARNAPVLAEIKSILAEGADLHWRRNAILHGTLTCKVNVVSIVPPLIESVLISQFIHKNRPSTLKLSEKEVESLFYKIATVTGRFRQFLAPDAQSPAFSAEDRSALRSFLLAHHPNPPMPPTLRRRGT